MKTNKFMKWSWTLMVLFLVLSIYDFKFGILGFICMTAPLYHVLKGDGKVHCQKYCPRGSILGRFLEKISMQNSLPKFMMKKAFKNVLLLLMISVFSFSMYHAGFNYNKIAFSVFRFMTISLILGFVLGVFFKPRSWCVICPMGHGSGLIDSKFKLKLKKKKQIELKQKKAA